MGEREGVSSACVCIRHHMRHNNRYHIIRAFRDPWLVDSEKSVAELVLFYV